LQQLEEKVGASQSHAVRATTDGDGDVEREVVGEEQQPDDVNCYEMPFLTREKGSHSRFDSI